MKLLDRGKKRLELEAAVKESIMNGTFTPGMRLPTFEQLNTQFNASKATFQHVINRLKEQGFVRGIERQGVFVADRLPHRNHFALLFDVHPNIFLSKIEKQAELLSKEGKYKFTVFRNDYSPSTHERNWGHLRKCLEEQSLAGLFFFFNPVDEEICQVLEDYPEVPTILYDNYPGKEKYSVLKLNPDSCAEKSLNIFLENKANRLAVISRAEQPNSASFVKAAARKKIDIPEQWRLSAPQHFISAAKNIVMLLLSLPKQQRPNGLYITDDNMLNAIQSGIVKMEVKVPQDLVVVCHTNFPDSPETIFPIQKVGYDVREILLLSVKAARAIKKTGKSSHSMIEGKYETEISDKNS